MVAYDRRMANIVALDQFITTNRAELIRRCEEKVMKRSGPSAAASEATLTEIEHGVPLFLDQLVAELRHGHASDDIAESSMQHGRDLLRQGFTVSQVVHDYGDVCQSVTDLAVELKAPIDTEDFRILNRCLDDAIAGAVTEHTRGTQVARDGQSDELRHLIQTAITAFSIIKTGTVGVAGRTGALVDASLAGMRVWIDQRDRPDHEPRVH